MMAGQNSIPNQDNALLPGLGNMPVMNVATVPAADYYRQAQALAKQGQLIQTIYASVQLLESDNQRLNDYSSSLETDNERLRDYSTSLETDNQRLKDYSTNLETDNQRLRDYSTSLETDNQQLKDRCAAATCKNEGGGRETMIRQMEKVDTKEQTVNEVASSSPQPGHTPARVQVDNGVVFCEGDQKLEKPDDESLEEGGNEWEGSPVGRSQNQETNDEAERCSVVTRAGAEDNHRLKDYCPSLEGVAANTCKNEGDGMQTVASEQDTKAQIVNQVVLSFPQPEHIPVMVQIDKETLLCEGDQKLEKPDDVNLEEGEYKQEETPSTDSAICFHLPVDRSQDLKTNEKVKACGVITRAKANKRGREQPRLNKQGPKIRKTEEQEADQESVESEFDESRFIGWDIDRRRTTRSMVKSSTDNYQVK